MKTFRKYNLFIGWGIFILSAIVYLLTIEPTTSFWDCGEFITSSLKLEVGHPPGAPFFMVLGRFFTLFAGSPQTVAKSMNIMSGLASAFTILFLFWTITHLARKILIKKDEDYSISRILSVMGAGAVGALAYTFSDTFWFSAVEAEVYATSSLFTAFVFWAILKWENIADTPQANRWIILIAYLMGLSIGVHLLNLLAVPAIVLVYYFRKYKATPRGIIISLLISAAMLGAMIYMIIPGIVAIGAKFELMFVNGFGLPFHSGLIFYSILLFLALGILIYITHIRGKVIWNTILVAFTVISIGYASYGVIIIRSNANTPLDESNPDTAFSLLRYLNRDQYGQTPLFYGNYFNTPAIEQKEGKPVYYREDGKYITMPTSDYVFSPEFRGFFPRMWSDQEQHINQYIYWTNMNEADLYEVVRDESGNPVRNSNGSYRFDRSNPKAIPSFGKNLKFFFRYQIGYMYLRYFMWNFAGRQNDIQGHGELTHGNWISGISFIDNARLGPQENLPDGLNNNKATNKYYFLPLILGILGIIFQYTNHKKDFWVVTLLFVLTGLAIVVYLNPYPVQPRERDYAYAGSFYAFSIWIGLGVLYLIKSISKSYKSLGAVVGVSFISLLLVPGVMAKENWDDHDRSGRYTARDFAHNYLYSCEPNGVIFTNGDNDTFPLWYIQEVEGVRTDVRIINLSYFTADWYIEQIASKTNDSEPVKFGLNKQQYRNGSRDYVMFADNALLMIDEKYEANKSKFKNEYEDIYSRFLTMAAKSKLPELAPKDYEALQKGPEQISIGLLANAINRVERRKDELSFDRTSMNQLVSDVESLAKRLDESYIYLDDAFKFLKTDDPRFKDGRAFFPGRKFSIPINKEEVLANDILNEEQQKDIVDEIKFEFAGRRGISKNSVMILDLINEVNKDGWKRPVYFAITASRDVFMDLDKYLHREGLAYRLLPALGDENDLFSGNVDADKMYDNVMNKFKWGNIEDPDVYLDENNLRMLTNMRYTFATLSNALIEKGKKDSALEVLDKCMELIPNDIAAFNGAIVPLIQLYYRMDQPEKANQIVRTFVNSLDRELAYYDKLRSAKPAKFSLSVNDYNMASRNLFSMFQIANSFDQDDIVMDITEIIRKYDSSFPGTMMYQ
jgi:hypothetical protein